MQRDTNARPLALEAVQLTHRSRRNVGKTKRIRHLPGSAIFRPIQNRGRTDTPMPPHRPLAPHRDFLEGDAAFAKGTPTQADRHPSVHWPKLADCVPAG